MQSIGKIDFANCIPESLNLSGDWKGLLTPSSTSCTAKTIYNVVANQRNGTYDYYWEYSNYGWMESIF